MMFSNLLFRRRVIRRVPVRRPIVYARPVQYGGSGNDIFYNNGTAGPAGPPGPQGPQGEPGPPGSLIVPVTVVTTTPYIPDSTEYFLCVDVPPNGAVQVILPASVVGKVFVVKDCSGIAQTNPITISAVAATIDGVATATINTNYGSLEFIFDGTEWHIV